MFERESKPTTKNGKKQANAFLNLEVTDANGNMHKLRAGVALFDESNV